MGNLFEDHKTFLKIPLLNVLILIALPSLCSLPLPYKLEYIAILF